MYVKFSICIVIFGWQCMLLREKATLFYGFARLSTISLYRWTYGPGIIRAEGHISKILDSTCIVSVCFSMCVRHEIDTVYHLCLNRQRQSPHI